MISSPGPIRWTRRVVLPALVVALVALALPAAGDQQGDLTFRYVAIDGYMYVHGTAANEDSETRFTPNGLIHVNRTRAHVTLVLQDAAHLPGTPVAVAIRDVGIVCIPVGKPYVVRTPGGYLHLHIHGAVSNFGVFAKPCQAYATAGSLVVRR